MIEAEAGCLQKYKQIFDDFEKLKVLVIGDVMLDHYCWGTVERISPEAPVPIVKILGTERRLGGAANVALNCRALGAGVFLATVIGDDDEGKQLLKQASESGLDTSLIRLSPERTTTSKTRILSRNQQMLRFDHELDTPLSVRDEHNFIDVTLRFLQIQRPDLVIFEDYNKGVLKENIIQKILKHCRTLKIPVAVDPKRDNFFAYQEVDIFKPNLKEVKDALKIDLEKESIALTDIHQLLKDRLNHHISLITLSEAGVFYQQDKKWETLPSHKRTIADVSGAGDTVIAVAGMVYTLTADPFLMATMANIAGGLVCEEVGVVPIDKSKLFDEVLKINGITKNKTTK